MSIYAHLSSNSETQFFRNFVDASIQYLSTNFPTSGLAAVVFDAYHTGSGTAFVPSQFAILGFAQSTGYPGVDPAGAHAAIFNTVQQDASPGSGQLLADFMLGFLIPGAAPLAALNGQSFLNANGDPGLMVNGVLVSDADAETPDAHVLNQVVGPSDAYFLIDKVVSSVPLSFNAPPPLQGSSGDDHLNGTAEDEAIQLNDGNDFFHGQRGNDSIEGQNGDDRLRGGGGDDMVSGGAGNDRLWGGRGVDEVNGGNGQDLMDGGKGNDVMNGGAEDDILKGGEGNDLVRGGYGNDLLHGNKGNDSLVGGAGDDILIDAQGNSTLRGGTGNDVLKGGVDNDTFVFEQGGGTDRVRDFGNGDDLLDMTDFALSGLADLTLSQQGATARIDLGTGEVILLDDTAAASLTGSDFLF